MWLEVELSISNTFHTTLSLLNTSAPYLTMLSDNSEVTSAVAQVLDNLYLINVVKVCHYVF